MPSEPFPIYQVSRDASFGTETMGTKGKFWWRDDDGGHWLFKFGRPDTGEHWAEKVVAHFAELLQVPAARVELAECDGKLGTIGRSFADEATMVHGNELLQAVDSTYPVHEIYGVRDHTVERAWGLGAGAATPAATMPRALAASSPTRSGVTASPRATSVGTSRAISAVRGQGCIWITRQRRLATPPTHF